MENSNNINLKEMDYSFLKCKNCIFNNDCETTFKSCPANFVSDKSESVEDFDFMHLKYCNEQNWNTLNDEAKEAFINEVLNENNKYDVIKEDNND